MKMYTKARNYDQNLSKSVWIYFK